MVREAPGLNRLSDCVFCAIVSGDEPAEIVAEWPTVLAIVPLHPVVPGHTLVLPKAHVADALVAPAMTGIVFEKAAELAHALTDVNLITSVGDAATQTVKHFHVHVVPRTDGDGLMLPWSIQEA